jgi:hypothetical protein
MQGFGRGIAHEVIKPDGFRGQSPAQNRPSATKNNNHRRPTNRRRWHKNNKHPKAKPTSPRAPDETADYRIRAERSSG